MAVAHRDDGPPSNRDDPRYQEAYRQQLAALQGVNDDEILAAQERAYANYHNVRHDIDLGDTYRAIYQAHADACADVLQEAATARMDAAIACGRPPVEFRKAGRSADETEPIPDEPAWSTEPGALPELARVPTLPARMIPQPLQSWLVDAAERTCQPLEMVAVPAVVALGAVVGRAIAIRPNRFDDFAVVPNLWGAVIARPGWMKSAALDEAMAPLKQLAAKAREAGEQARAQEEVKRAILEAEIDGFKTQMKAAVKENKPLEGPGAQLAKKQQELRDLRTPERRYFTQDSTIEKLAELLRDNPRGLLVLRDELSGWLRTLEKQGREGDREFYLEAWNGTVYDYTTDRIGRGTVHIPALTIAICGGIQPGKLSSYIADAMDGHAGDDGLLQRFQLMVWPDALPAWKKPDRYPDREARRTACVVFERLDKLDPLGIGATQDDERGIPYLRFTPAAQAVWDAWRDALEHRLRGDEIADMPAFESHLAKYRSLMPALALLFHLVDLVDAGVEPTISKGVDEPSARLAAAWCDFLEAHARKVYGEETNRGVSAAHTLARRIRAGDVKDGATVRAVYRPQWSNLRTSRQVEQALAVLSEAGWVHVESVATNGRPTEVIHIHPVLRKGQKKS